MLGALAPMLMYPIIAVSSMLAAMWLTWKEKRDAMYTGEWKDKEQDSSYIAGYAHVSAIVDGTRKAVTRKVRCYIVYNEATNRWTFDAKVVFPPATEQGADGMIEFVADGARTRSVSFAVEPSMIVEGDTITSPGQLPPRVAPPAEPEPVVHPGGRFAGLDI